MGKSFSLSWLAQIQFLNPYGPLNQPGVIFDYRVKSNNPPPQVCPKSKIKQRKAKIAQ